MRRGFYSGLIAAILAGVLFTLVRGFYTIAFRELVAYDFIIYHLFYAIGLNGIYGAIFGSVYSLFYDRIPSTGIKKGLVFGFIIYFISIIFIASDQLLRGLLTGVEQYYVFSYEWIVGGLNLWIPYGVILGLLYTRLKI